MDREKMIHKWKQNRRSVAVPGDFSAGVMAEIQARKVEPARDTPSDDITFSSRLLRWATAWGLALLGLFRILYIVINLCRPHLAMP